jgi:sugar lactone lactonase YvrE
MAAMFVLNARPFANVYGSLLLSLLPVCLTQIASAHPGNGIAVGGDGTVYFADVGRTTIWKFSEGGKPEPLVRDTWTHGIQLAGDGSLYYERELPGEGVTPQDFWKVSPAGKKERLIAPQADRSRFGGVSFAVTKDGTVYFAHSERGHDGEWRALLRKRTPDGEVSTLAGSLTEPLYQDGKGNKASFRIVTGMAIGHDGAIYVLDRDRLRRVTTDGVVTTIAKGLLDENPKDSPHKSGPPTTINRLYGLAMAPDGSAYIAYQAGRRVIRVAPDGKVKTVLSVSRPWSPIGVAVSAKTLYVLEIGDASVRNGPRVRRVGADGKAETVCVVE